MTIPAPRFMLINECPGWCTVDHEQVELGDHETEVINWRCDGVDRDSVDLIADPEDGVDVALWLGGEQVFRMPVAEAEGRLMEVARAALTAVYRLGVIETAEDAVKGTEVTYKLEFTNELLPLGDAARLLLRESTREEAPEIADALDAGNVAGAAEAFLERLDAEQQRPAGPAQPDVDALRGLLDLMENFRDNDQRARYLLSSDWMRARTEGRA